MRGETSESKQICFGVFSATWKWKGMGNIALQATCMNGISLQGYVSL